MTYLVENLLIISLIFSLGFLLIGLLLYQFPPKDINMLYGYRTPRSMKTKEHWVFAQKFASKKSFDCFLLLLLSSCLGLFYDFNSNVKMYLQFSFIVLSIIYYFISVELAIKKYINKKSD